MIMAWLTSSGLGAIKPVLAALVLPPVPLLALALAGAWWAPARPRTGRLLVTVACIGLWFSSCNIGAAWAEQHLLQEPPALASADRAQLKAMAASGASMAIVVLGGGVDRRAPEYGSPTLAGTPLSRLRYGVWLSRETGIPLAVSGGVGWGASDESPLPEAALMARIADSEFGQHVEWTDATSRDTRENAANCVRLLKAAGVAGIVVVTNGWHMPRALRDFRAAAAAAGDPFLRIRAAPMGQAYPAERPVLDWMPSGSGAERTRAVLREAMAALADRE
jgi:uncharacterized SAM-binding protein YcdF (DUF218 family)